MERRYLAFFASSFAIILLWRVLFPQPVPVNPKAKADANEAVAENIEGELAQAPAVGDGNDQAEQQPQPIAAEIAADPPANSPHYLTLGSIDPASPYRFAATFDSHGGTIRRLELASHKYRDLHNLGGYLGNLELANLPEGATVQNVVPGSPAAEAGIETGDVITAVTANGANATKGEDVATSSDLERLLSKTKPGDTVEISITHDGNPQQLTAKLIRAPLNLIRPETENILLHSDRVPTDLVQHPSLELSISKVGPNIPAAAVLAEANEQLATGVWNVDDSQSDQLVFRMVLPKLGLEALKRFAIAKVPSEKADESKYPAYHLDFEVEIRNLLATPQKINYKLQGPNGLPIEGFWYSNKVGRGWSGYGIRDVLLRTHGNTEKDFPARKIAELDIDAYGDGESLAYVGVDAQYFAAAMLPKKETIDERWYARFKPNLASYQYDEKQAVLDKEDGVAQDRQGVVIEKRGYKQRYVNASYMLTSSSLELAATDTAGDSKAHSTTLFVGPKHPELLAKYQAAASSEYSLDDFVYYGWFGNLGIPQLMVGVLQTFYGIFRNYGLAIIFLTVLVRSCMFPLSRKQAKNMLMMQELKPEMERIAARHKDDVQARTKAQQELWAKHNYNPMGGCLLMFVQLPIFIGLYRALMVDVDLRQAALIPGIRWCSNLAAPDMAFNWSNFIWPHWFVNGEGMLALGPYLNILPLATVGLFLLQQKLFMPPAADEQAEMMQKVMKYMMLFMSFMFFKVASGLCLYFIASSLWGIAERKLIPRPEPPAGAASATTTPPNDSPRKKKRPNGKSGNKPGKGGGKRKR